MAEAHEKGTPLLRTLFLELPKDKTAWQIEDEYCNGSCYLTAHILEAGQRMRKVYLPSGANWKHTDSGACFYACYQKTR